MAKNEFLPFGIADGANVLSNDEYGKLATRTNGFSSGVAKSQELNKVWRQASVIANVVAQFIAETNNQDVLDDGNTAALQKGLLNALRATVDSNIPVASQTVAGIAKLSNATNSEAENVAATPKAVKQAADMANQARTEAGNANATANTANQNAGNAITNANTAIQNAANANNNANTRLEKEQNGADIENKQRFVYNLGLTDTVDLAASAIPKSAITHYSGGSETLVMSQSVTSQLISERIKKSDAELLAVPIGGILIWCSPLSYPNNFLPMEGGYIDRGKYPELLKHYPSGRLPDWRGYVPRGWDNERGVDNGRELGSFQDDAIRDITGIFRTGSRKEDGTPDRTNGAFSTLKAGNNIAVYGDSDRLNAYTYEDREFRASWVVPTATENRMKNVAVIFLIRGR
ncbi:phage tail protein [Xenorhabdus bovienii]|uniref:phage tail protein n=1 Tax=Xenorhabdus bovienii TaxID=40576 RepID=UPI001EDCF36C|nr:phage tail protein [Xenorhabdus bovienii]MCG3461658.1 phage tail protein [Xenorhabdus bovienii]